jgi:acyl-coenzyme A synthetase/AMP-(fatty) acid ligase
VKIRGNRVELGEIESVLAEHERIAQAIVVLIGQGAARRPAAVIVPAPR